mgnify:CR=1 FL=1
MVGISSSDIIGLVKIISEMKINPDTFLMIVMLLVVISFTLKSLIKK